MNREVTLSPSRRLIPSSSIKAKVSIVVSFLSSSLLSSGESLHHVTIKPKELFPLLSSNAHLRYTPMPDISASICGTEEDGGCGSEGSNTTCFIGGTNLKLQYTFLEYQTYVPNCLLYVLWFFLCIIRLHTGILLKNILSKLWIFIFWWPFLLKW